MCVCVYIYIQSLPQRIKCLERIVDQGAFEAARNGSQLVAEINERGTIGLSLLVPPHGHCLVHPVAADLLKKKEVT